MEDNQFDGIQTIGISQPTSLFLSLFCFVFIVCHSFLMYILTITSDFFFFRPSTSNHVHMH